MAIYFPNVDPIYLYRREGTDQDPYIQLNENLTISNNYVHLKEIPDYKTKVRIRTKDNISLKEVTTETLNTNEFRVDYTTGVVYFYPQLNGKDIIVTYLGTGYVDFPAARINTDGKGTLQDLINTIDSIRTKWHPPVSNYEDIPNAVPNPTNGDTLIVSTTGKVYRYEKGEWLNTQTINDNIVTNLMNRIDELESNIDAGGFTETIDDSPLDGGVF